MNHIFAALDEHLIERIFQPLCGLAADYFGIGRIAAVCFCLDLAGLAWIVSRAPALSHAVTARDVAATALDLSVLLLGLAAVTALRTLFRRNAGRTGNPLRLTMRPHRGIILLMLASRLLRIPVLSLADGADMMMLLAATAALYLGACVEPPPVRRTEAVAPASAS